MWVNFTKPLQQYFSLVWLFFKQQASFLTFTKNWHHHNSKLINNKSNGQNKNPNRNNSINNNQIKQHNRTNCKSQSVFMFKIKSQTWRKISKSKNQKKRMFNIISVKQMIILMKKNRFRTEKALDFTICT